MAPPNLLDLPNELLLQLPSYMNNIEDFMNASSTCKRLRNLFTNTLPKTILRLASRSAPTFFSPHPHFLVLAVARQIAAWAVASQAERETRVALLVEAFRGGMKGVLSLALSDDVEGVGLTMEDIRKMYELRFNIINPLNTTIDAMIGSEWYQQPAFWNGGAEDAFTLYTDVSSATFQFLIYGELFGGTTSSFLLPSSNRKPALNIDTRIEFIKYCIPDWSCGPNNGRNDGFELLSVGPYAEGAEDSPYGDKLEGNQTALAHLVGGAMFRGTLWKRAWRRVLIAAGMEENEDGKWPEAWIQRMQRTEFRKEMKIVVSDGEEIAVKDSNTNNETDVTAADGKGEASTGEESEADQVEEDEAEDEENEESDEEEDEYDDNDEDEDDGDDENESSEDEANVYGHPNNWRFFLFWTALTQVGGLQTMEMVAQFKGREENRDAVMRTEWKAQILRLRDQVLALKDEDEPGFKELGKNRKLKVSEAPHLGAELYWCCAGMWNGF
ncbi:uncharacterized protein N0V89_010587 [Didymosphaeria variabile]|uniref:F-box domain-containing protein n=1 Tax=Didymosphaeria variabile TaxID=1932322 RepID=A0A9W9C6A1_9PLEO|nr:uncharacterized protein N0V89_010587 [Didymosphaeria variabile]KAJ4346656.1 hypothetical protein N0V89_010587 [Didymosphaeria variabile]